MNEFTISSAAEKVSLSLEEESMVFTRYIPRIFIVGLSIRISADILWDLNQLQKRDAFMDDFIILRWVKPWWFHVEVKPLITLMQWPELLPYTAV